MTARKKPVEAAAETETEAVAEEAAVETEVAAPRTEVPDVSSAATGGAAQGRAVILPGGERRIDYIKRRWVEDGASRSLIAKELTELQGKPIPYQIVFQATKGLEGGPKVATAEPAAPVVAEDKTETDEEAV